MIRRLRLVASETNNGRSLLASTHFRCSALISSLIDRGDSFTNSAKGACGRQWRQDSAGDQRRVRLRSMPLLISSMQASVADSNDPVFTVAHDIRRATLQDNKTPPSRRLLSHVKFNRAMTHKFRLATQSSARASHQQALAFLRPGHTSVWGLQSNGVHPTN
jgi:hypothetical protein